MRMRHPPHPLFRKNEISRKGPSDIVAKKIKMFVHIYMYTFR